MKIPASVYSQIGPVPVTFDASIAEGEPENLALGVFDKQKRTIKLDPASTRESQVATLMHEAIHVALWDSGCENTLTEVQVESICDAVGTYLAGALIGGYLRFGRPR